MNKIDYNELIQKCSELLMKEERKPSFLQTTHKIEILSNCLLAVERARIYIKQYEELMQTSQINFEKYLRKKGA